MENLNVGSDLGVSPGLPGAALSASISPRKARICTPIADARARQRSLNTYGDLPESMLADILGYTIGEKCPWRHDVPVEAVEPMTETVGRMEARPGATGPTPDLSRIRRKYEPKFHKASDRELYELTTRPQKPRFTKENRKEPRDGHYIKPLLWTKEERAARKKIDRLDVVSLEAVIKGAKKAGLRTKAMASHDVITGSKRLKYARKQNLKKANEVNKNRRSA